MMPFKGRFIEAATAAVAVILTTTRTSMTQGHPYLKSLPAYERLRQNSSKNLTRIHNLDVLSSSSDSDNGDDDIGFCHLIEMNRHSLLINNKKDDDDGSPTRMTFPSDYPLESLAAVALAAEHLNTGDGSVIPEIHNLHLHCPIRFTTEFMDTAGIESQAVDSVISILQRPPHQLSSNNSGRPCAFIGAFRSPVSIATALYTSLKGYPQFSTLSGASELDNKNIYPLFGRFIPTSFALPFLDFISNTFHLTHLAVVHTDNSLGISYLNGLRNAISNQYPHITMQAVGFPDTTTTDFVPTVQALKATGYRYIFAIIATSHYPPLILESYRQGIAGTGQHTWILSNKAIPATYLLRKQFTPQDPMLLSSRGLLLYDTSVGSLPNIGRYDQYIHSWSKLANDEDITYLQSKVPTFPNDPMYNPIFTKETFQLGRFTPATATVYDATIALGLGACAAAATSHKNHDSYFTGKQHYDSILNTTFIGASGTISLDPTTGSRDSKSNLYAITNAITVPIDNNNNNNNPNLTFHEIRTHYYDHASWHSIQSITYNHGQTNPIPLDLPPIADMNYHYLGNGLRILGLSLSMIILISSIGFSLWTKIHQNRYIIRASQPIFLYYICFGTFLLGASIIPLSLDDEILSNNQNNNNDYSSMNIVCTSIPWLQSLGWCISFSALFSKTKRINTIFHNPDRFKRIVVEARDVMIPMIILICCHVVILCTWSIISPLSWERKFDDVREDQYGRVVESQGRCQSDLFWEFCIPLLVLDLGSLIYAIHQAYVSRKISTEFAESEWIARAMSFIMLVSFVGLPILILAKDDDPRASYFVRCALVFVVCFSLLGFIFIPKLLLLQSKQKRSAATLSVQSTLMNLSNGGTSSKQQQQQQQCESLESQDSFYNNKKQQRRRSSSLLSTSSTSPSSPSSSVEGMIVLDHPIIQQRLQEELYKWKEANRVLELKLAEYEKTSQSCLGGETVLLNEE